MTIKIVALPKKNPRKPEEPARYYAAVQSSGHADLRKLARRISESSTVSSADTLAVLEALLMVVPQELLEGNIVKLGDLGTFRLTVTSTPVETADKITSHNIKSLNVRFTPGKLFKQNMVSAEYEKISD